VFITGQVNRHEQKGALGVRQLGFQETDIVAMAAPVTKAAWRVQTADEVAPRLREAFRTACGGRPGPVLLDIPMDLQRVAVDAPVEAVMAGADAQPDGTAELPALLDALRRSRRPLVLVGGGVGAARATRAFRAFADRLGVPVVCSLLGVDVLPALHRLRVGMLGSYGNRWANLAIGRSDLLLVLGSRLDIRQTGAMAEAFKGGRVVFHVDCDASEINNRVRGCVPVVAQLRPFLESALAELERAAALPERREWLAEIASLRAQWPDSQELKDTPGINPNVFMHELSALGRDAAAYVVDVGQHQMWAAQSLDLEAHQRFLTSGGMGAMGFALPAAVGAALAADGAPTVMIAGDGGVQLNIQELQTVAHNALPVKMVVLNNRCHGMVRQFQESYFDERYPSTMWGYSAPDFERVANAYGIAAATISEPADVDRALRAMWKDPKAPFLLQVMIHPYANVYPKIAFGHPITEMEPFAKPLEMEGT
jgi:acetolactate synthase-1/2/3 large subunit